jgi:DNA-binding transcriptional LysR family regulator
LQGASLGYRKLPSIRLETQMFSRFARYFDEVARSGSIRRASDRLHIAPSAVDRQILKMEEQLGIPLFERMPQGLRLTAAGEVLVEAVRRWRRDYARVKSQIDELQGLKRGEVSIALAEGAVDFLARNLKTFQEAYPGIAFQMLVHGSNKVVDLVMSKEVDIALAFNPPDSHALRVERSLVYQIGVVVAPSHPLAGRAEIDLAECVTYPLIIPDDTLSLRSVFDSAWASSLGGIEQFAISVNSIGLMRKLVVEALGIAILTKMDVLAEFKAGSVTYMPLSNRGVPLSVLSLISSSGRTLSVPALMLLQHLGRAMEEEDAPMVDG